MKTTLDLSDELLVEAKAIAARRHTTLKAIVEHALRREISAYAEDGQGREGTARVFELDADGIPFLKSRGGKVSSDTVYALLDEDDG